MVCEYNESVVDGIRMNLRGEVWMCRKEREEIRREGRKGESVRWNHVCRCSRCV